MDSQQSFYHTSFICGELFGSADLYRLFREKIMPKLFTLRELLEALYCENNGRPGIDPVLLCGVTLTPYSCDDPRILCVTHFPWPPLEPNRL